MKGETIGANFWQGKVQILRDNGDVTSVSLLPSHNFRLSLSLSSIVPHAQYRKRGSASYNRKRFRASYKYSTHIIGSGEALPILCARCVCV